jgi:HTH-type transcriptional regulator/antitoxin HigA
MNVKQIESDNDYLVTLKTIERLMSAGANTAASDELSMLTTLVEVWEQKRFPLELRDS